MDKTQVDRSLYEQVLTLEAQIKRTKLEFNSGNGRVSWMQLGLLRLACQDVFRGVDNLTSPEIHNESGN